MPTGTVCPSCGKQVMPYLRVFREAEPTKVSRCSNCDVALKRRKSVWLLLAIGVGLFGLAVVAIGPSVYRSGLPLFIAFVVVAVAVFTLCINICGWLFVGWDIAKRDSANI